MADRIITQLPAIPKPATFKEAAKATLRVAAYARVSTDNEDQETSLAAQTDYYKKKILEHLGWEFVQIYVDDGISGLSTKHRDGFNKLIADCLSGHIDLVLTKSISRFARNTVDTVTTIRMLKEKGVGVYFEKENIFTTDSKGGISANNHVLAGTGGEPLHIGEHHMGTTKAIVGWQSKPCLQSFSWV